MLQTVVEDAEGKTHWRDIACEDEDDWLSRWAHPFRLDDYGVRGDAIFGMAESYAMETPADMVRKFSEGWDGSGYAFRSDLYTTVTGVDDADQECVAPPTDGVVGFNIILDRRISDRTRSESMPIGGIVLSAPQRGRPKSKSNHSRDAAKEKIILWRLNPRLLLPPRRLPGRVAKYDVRSRKSALL